LPVYTEAQEKLGGAYPGTTEDVLSPGAEWLEFDFSESLMSVGNIREAIDKSKKLSTLYPEALTWAKSSNSQDSLLAAVERPVGAVAQVDAESLYVLCQKVQFAEQIDTDEMLATEPLRNLGKQFSAELPNAVSVGAKGAGKTFTFLQVCRSKTWPALFDETGSFASFEWESSNISSNMV